MKDGIIPHAPKMADAGRWVLSAEGAKAFEQAKQWREKRRHHKERRKSERQS